MEPVRFDVRRKTRGKMHKTLGLLAAVLISSCSAGFIPPDSTDGVEPGEPADGVAVVDWTDPSKPVVLEDGWTVHACEGDAPLLCVEAGGTHVGVVEALFFPVESFEALDPRADLEANLGALAQDFIESFRTDRASGCGSDYGFRPLEPEPFVLANRSALAYGFEGTTSNGDPSELILQYATIENGHVVLIVVAAHDEGGCPGRDELSGFDSSTLSRFRPHLERLLRQSPLPEFEM